MPGNCPETARKLPALEVCLVNDILDAALDYTARGWPVIPLCWPARDRCGCGRGHECRDVGKAPLLGRDYQHVRADEQQVRAWWRRWPQANVGLLLEPAALLVVDLDGREAVAEADARGCADTHTVRRGDHLHLYFSRPADVEPGRRTKKGRCGAIDVLAAGYLVAPPSLHKLGDHYEVARDLPLAAPPAWAVDILRDANPDVSVADIIPDDDAMGALAEARALLAGHRMAAVLEDGPDGDPGRYDHPEDSRPDRSAAEAAVVGALLDRGMAPERVAAALLARPWAATMRRHPATWLPRDVARMDARRLHPADDATALAAFRALPPDIRKLVASTAPKRRAAGAKAAVQAGCSPEALAAALLAAGTERSDALGLARWAVSTAAPRGGEPHAG